MPDKPQGTQLWFPAPEKFLRLPPQSFFGVSAVFHYLGPSLAVLLFARLDVLGVAWLRVASAALVFALWRRPWRLARRLSPEDRRSLLGLGVLLAVMNSAFYLAVDRLPLSTVGATEFLDQLAMARLPRATFSLMLALLPAFATIIGAVVLRQLPTVQDVAGITLVALGVAIHREGKREDMT